MLPKTGLKCSNGLPAEMTGVVTGDAEMVVAGEIDSVVNQDKSINYRVTRS